MSLIAIYAGLAVAIVVAIGLLKKGGGAIFDAIDFSSSPAGCFTAFAIFFGFLVIVGFIFSVVVVLLTELGI